MNPNYRIETELNEADHWWVRVLMPLSVCMGLILMTLVLVGYFLYAKGFDLVTFYEIPAVQWRVALTEVIPFTGMLLTLWGGIQSSIRPKVTGHLENAMKQIEDVRAFPASYADCGESDLANHQRRVDNLQKRLEADKRFWPVARVFGIFTIVVGLMMVPFNP